MPIDRLICASNSNKVLYDFFRTGDYDRRRDFHLTMSPSMDILISSNLERLIYQILDCDPVKTSADMEDLNQKGIAEINLDLLKKKVPDFYGNYASEEETAAEIRAVYEDTGYVIDPHTAVASSVYEKYKEETGDSTKTLIASTASPFKFTRTVLQAIGADQPDKEDLDLTEDLSKIANVEIPAAIREIKDAPVRHTTICEVSEMPDEIRKILAK